MALGWLTIMLDACRILSWMRRDDAGEIKRSHLLINNINHLGIFLYQHSAHMVPQVRDRVVYCKLNDSFSSLSLLTPILVGIILQPRKCAFIPRDRIHDGAPTIVRTKRNIWTMCVDQRPGVDLQHVVLLVAVCACSQQPMQSVFS